MQSIQIYSAAGNVRLGHIVKLDPRMITDINIYLRLHPEFDIASKCILIGAAMFLVRYKNIVNRTKEATFPFPAHIPYVPPCSSNRVFLTSFGFLCR